jgi:hypothetical protein
MWDLWWTKWHWGRFFPEYFGFPPSKLIILIIFITGLHNKPQSCGASVVSAAGPFFTTTKKKKDGISIIEASSYLQIYVFEDS